MKSQKNQCINSCTRNKVTKTRTLNRSALMKTHAVLAAFILPVAILFLVTGALYTWGIKGGYETTTHELHLKKPVQDDVVSLTELVKNELKRKDIEAPSGQAKIKRIGSSFRLEWTGSNMDIILEPTSQPLMAQLEIKNTSWLRQFVQLHKAKGGTPFKVYAVVFVTALLLLLISGFIMAWQMPKLHKLTLVSASFGLVIFFVMVISS